MITIIDYGVGNLGSIQNMLLKIEASFKVTSNVAEISKADKIILPGVGSFDFAMKKLHENRIPEVLSEKAAAGTPILGICLGAQLLTKGSEEGILPGLNLLDAHCEKFNASKMNSLKVPHIGWDEVYIKSENEIIQSSDDDEQTRFYFAHSYHMVAKEEIVLATSIYGYEFSSILLNGNILAAQFHPEKSHYFGMNFLRNFSHWRP